MVTPKPNSNPLLIEAADRFDAVNEKLFDQQNLLQMFHISVRTLQYWRSKGIIPYTKIRSKIFYRQKDVEDMLHKNRVLKNKLVNDAKQNNRQ